MDLKSFSYNAVVKFLAMMICYLTFMLTATWFSPGH